MRVINPKYLPTRPPLIATIVGVLCLDHVGCPGWAWGVFWTITALAWIGWGILLHKQEHCEPTLKP